MKLKTLFAMFIMWLTTIAAEAQVVPSVAGDEHWYYLTAVVPTSKLYDGAVVYNTSADGNSFVRWGDKTLDVNAMWKFEPSSDGKGYLLSNKANKGYLAKVANGSKQVFVETRPQREDAAVFTIVPQTGTSTYQLRNEESGAFTMLVASYMTVLMDLPTDDYGKGASWQFREVTPEELSVAEAKEASWAKGLTMVWNDEFDGTTAELKNKWGFEHGFVRNQEAQWYQPENASVTDGHLLIQGRLAHEPNPNYVAGSNDWKLNREYIDYTSSLLKTAKKFDFMYGRLEVKAVIPTSAGAWPAIWTLGNNDYKSGFHWPHSGEVDLMEYFRNELQGNIYWGANGKLDVAGWRCKTPLSYLKFHDAHWASTPHVWRMDWDEESIKLYVDNVLYAVVNLDNTVNQYDKAAGTNPYRDHYQYILLNLAFGGIAGGKIDNSTFPVDYMVDYVRVYQKKGQKHRFGNKVVTTGIEGVRTTQKDQRLDCQVTDGMLRLQVSESAILTLRAADGTPVLRRSLQLGSSEVSLAPLARGVYILTLQEGNHAKTAKITW